MKSNFCSDRAVRLGLARCTIRRGARPSPALQPWPHRSLSLGLSWVRTTVHARFNDAFAAPSDVALVFFGCIPEADSQRRRPRCDDDATMRRRDGATRRRRDETTTRRPDDGAGLELSQSLQLQLSQSQILQSLHALPAQTELRCSFESKRAVLEAISGSKTARIPKSNRFRSCRVSEISDPADVLTQR